MNGEGVTNYILYLAQNTTFGSYQDPDALYNSFFWGWNDQTDLLNWPGAFPFILPPPFETFTNLTFENGSTVSTPNYVITTADFSSVVDGDSFYQSFLNYSAQASGAAASSTVSATDLPAPTETSSQTSSTAESASATTATSILGYPTPTAISSDGALSGYFLEGEGFEDTAVLAIRIMTEGAAESFQETLTEFLDACRTNNKQQLVIDVTNNPGGNIALAYDLIKQLFPSIEPYGAGNYRAQEGFRLLGETITRLSNDTVQEEPNNYTDFINNWGVSAFDSLPYLDVDNQPFPDFAAYYDPHSAPNDYGNYTSLTRNNLSSIDYYEATSTIVVSGYGNMTDLAPQPFDNKNVILLTDGQCSSTCTIFSHFLKYQAKVKSVTFGGRPTKGPMQAIGGIKGSQVEPVIRTVAVIETAAEYIVSGLNETLDDWVDTPLDPIYNYGEYLVSRTASKGKVSSEFSYNIRNNIAEGDTSITPLQFIYEAADCRLYFQPKHILDITNIWKDVATQAFGLNGTDVFSGCVAGSTNQPSSLSGDADLYANGTIQNATAVEAGTAILNQTEGSGNKTGGVGPYHGAAGRSQTSYSLAFGGLLLAFAWVL